MWTNGVIFPQHVRIYRGPKLDKMMESAVSSLSDEDTKQKLSSIKQLDLLSWWLSESSSGQHKNY